MSQILDVKPVKQTLFQTKDSLKEALEYARSLMPDASHNVFMQAMMTYHNSLILQIDKNSQGETNEQSK